MSGNGRRHLKLTLSKLVFRSEQMKILGKTLTKTTLIDVLIKGIFLFILLLFIHIDKQHSPNRDDAKLQELRQIKASIPAFPTFSESSSGDSSRATDAGIYTWYRSSASHGEVKSYYTRVLTSMGWDLSGEEKVQHWYQDYGTQLKFRKGEFRIAILCVNRDTEAYQYAINYNWRDSSSNLWRNE
jgi:hypothetical protein